MFNSPPNKLDFSQKAFVCRFPGCGKTVSSLFSLRRHHTLVHTKTRKYRCPTCHKEFALKQYLDEHSVTHSDESPFLCGIDGCTLRFRQRGTLCNHRKNHGVKVPRTRPRTRGFKRDGESSAAPPRSQQAIKDPAASLQLCVAPFKLNLLFGSILPT